MNHDADKPLVIIGAGPGGVAAALRASQLGAQVKLIEADKVGGVCTSRGCIPMRVLGSAVDLAGRMAMAGGLGLAEAAPALLPHKLTARISETSGYIRLGTEALLGAKGVELIRGRGCLAGPEKVKVGDRLIAARAIILAAGARWARPRLPGSGLEGVVTSDDLLADLENPGRLIVLGDQPWAVELARFMTALGGKVTLASPGGLLPQVDRQIAGRLRKALKEIGLEVIQKARPLSISKADSRLRVELEIKGKPGSLKRTGFCLPNGGLPGRAWAFGPPGWRWPRDG